MTEPWECIIVGGGAAGLSAALVLGRARRRTLLVDSGGQSNRPAHGIGGLLGHDGRPPTELYATGRQELAAYPAVEVRDGSVTAAASTAGGFTVTLDDGTVEMTRQLILATGMDYRLPELPGVAERWGRSVFHCPFCHGWEVRDRPLAVLDSDPTTGVHRALLLTGWSADVTLLTNGPAGLTDADRDHLVGAGVTIDERAVTALHGPGDELSTIRFADGTQRPCGGLLVPAVLHQRSTLAAQLGLEFAAPTPIAADAIDISPTGETSVPGVLVAGDASVGMPSVANAIAAGSNAAAAVVRNLLFEHDRLQLHGRKH
ncbi:MAG TPA: NAD(P)/FAD-dependent oxidoreductase [Ilumatobacteraceae bacterium]|nr:NAD(P)/FAD-dependent oxidoreductase [Ilumatobacteraceae bacterium]